MVPGDRNVHPYANPHAPHGNRPELPQPIRTHRKTGAKDPHLLGEQITTSRSLIRPWPTGRYKIDVTVDGNVVRSREFEVK